jgi:thiaminase
MNKILVPIQDFSYLSLSASYFSIKFAKRNPTKILFLIFSNASGEETSMKEEDRTWRRQFERLIQQARAEKINLELFFSNEEYLQAVRQFARDHNTTEIIIALPPAQDRAYHKVIQEVNALRNQGENQIIVIKPKEEQGVGDAKKPLAREPYAIDSRAYSGKKGS